MLNIRLINRDFLIFYSKFANLFIFLFKIGDLKMQIYGNTEIPILFTISNSVSVGLVLVKLMLQKDSSV